MANDPLAGLRAEAQERQEREVLAHLATMPHDGPLPAPTAPFSVSNDDALAAHLAETRANNTEYLRLRSEESRQQYLDAAADNFRRTRAQKEEGTLLAAIQREQREVIDQRDVDALIKRADALAATLPADWTPETVPLEKLKAIADLRQQINDTAAKIGSPGLVDGAWERGPLAPGQRQAQAQPAQPRAETFPDGSLYQLKNLPDGNLEVQLITGERFSGDPIAVTQELSKAQVLTKRWGQQQRSQQQQQVSQPQQIAPPEPTQQSTIADYWAEAQAQSLAKQFGFNDKNELLQWGENINQKMAQVEHFENERLAMNFATRCPDFPGTDASIAAITGIVDANGWQYTADNLQAAHAVAVQRNLYQPLSAQEIQIANGHTPQMSRQAPPPMIRSSAPDSHNQGRSPYEMPMDELRRAAIRQQMEQEGRA